MSREDEDKKTAEDFVRWNGNIAHLSGMLLVQQRANDFLAGIAYGRATPDREMLLRLLNFADCADCDFTNEERRKSIDEFLTLENQRGEK